MIATRGPWKTRIAQPGTMLEVVSEKREYVCSLLGGEEYKQANAHLIAAAPDMLKFIESLKDIIGPATIIRRDGMKSVGLSELSEIYQAMLTILNKIEGE